MVERPRRKVFIRTSGRIYFNRRESDMANVYGSGRNKYLAGRRRRNLRLLDRNHFMGVRGMAESQIRQHKIGRQGIRSKIGGINETLCNFVDNHDFDKWVCENGPRIGHGRSYGTDWSS